MLFQLTVHPGGPAFNLPIKIEIIIGTVPLHQNFTLPLTPTETFIKTLQFSHYQSDKTDKNDVSNGSSSGQNSRINQNGIKKKSNESASSSSKGRVVSLYHS